MAQYPIAPAALRDRNLQLLRDLTFAIGAVGAGLLGLFAIVAATTVPGHSDSGQAAAGNQTASNTNASTDPANNGDDQFQPPSQGAFGPAASAPHVVSGGSR